ncbi:hypothetical protein WMY93_014591 [Mugilogobius chulae]|uniref:Uncharacterized protein n=1 Tax=Mugilogobius chulae TaxID=88201 RepID=A0AAW0P1Y2_9GOBI
MEFHTLVHSVDQPTTSASRVIVRSPRAGVQPPPAVPRPTIGTVGGGRVVGAVGDARGSSLSCQPQQQANYRPQFQAQDRLYLWSIAELQREVELRSLPKAWCTVAASYRTCHARGREREERERGEREKKERERAVRGREEREKGREGGDENREGGREEGVKIERERERRKEEEEEERESGEGGERRKRREKKEEMKIEREGEEREEDRKRDSKGVEREKKERGGEKRERRERVRRE